MTNSNDNANQRGRSRAYPVIPLSEALEKIKAINVNLGVKGQFNRESIASGMGYTSLNGTSGRRVAALVQYGFLDREKDQYFLSSLAKQYLLPVSDNDQVNAVQEAALTPPLFSDIYNVLKGQVLPRQLINRLIHEFSIEQKAAKDVDRIFKETMEVAGILQPNGILNSEVTSQSETPPNHSSDTPSLASSRQPNTGTTAPTDYLSVELPSGLIVSYSKELAPSFAFGTFGAELKALDDAVIKHTESLTIKEEE